MRSRNGVVTNGSRVSGSCDVDRSCNDCMVMEEEESETAENPEDEVGDLLLIVGVGLLSGAVSWLLCDLIE